MSITCEPQQFISGEPCVQCLSDHELDAALAFILCKIVGESAETECTPEVLLETCACYTCLSDHQLKGALVNMFGQYAYELGYIENLGTGQLLQEFSCIKCMTPKQLKAVIVCLMCGFLTKALECEEGRFI